MSIISKSAVATGDGKFVIEEVKRFRQLLEEQLPKAEQLAQTNQWDYQESKFNGQLVALSRREKQQHVQQQTARL